MTFKKKLNRIYKQSKALIQKGEGIYSAGEKARLKRLSTRKRKYKSLSSVGESFSIVTGKLPSHIKKRQKEYLFK